MSIQYTVLDLNSRPLEHESPHITTRPGLSPYLQGLYSFTLLDFSVFVILQMNV